MFAYDAMTEQEAMNSRYQLMKDGEYDAVIITSEDKISANSGNPMMDMTLHVYDEDGKSHDVRDFLVFTKSMMWKVIHCADSAGLNKEYMEGKFCSDLVNGCSVRVKIGTEIGSEIPEDKLKGKPLGSRYPNKNKVEDYIKKEDQKPLAHKAGEDDILSDQIPF